jgi:hypothetical protein
MRYQKPSIVLLGSASSAIQGHAIKGVKSTDANPLTTELSTGNAYDLDE